jgi:hypothetical protein
MYTPFMKIVPVPFIAGATVLILVAILSDTRPLFPDGVTMLGITLAGLAFFSWYSSRLKFVNVDNDNLYVSGWLKGSAIPLSEVNDVYYSAGVGLVFVRLKSPSTFGHTIAFMPTLGSLILSTLGSHSVVEELRGLAKKASTSSQDAI